MLQRDEVKPKHSGFETSFKIPTHSSAQLIFSHASSKEVSVGRWTTLVLNEIFKKNVGLLIVTF